MPHDLGKFIIVLQRGLGHLPRYYVFVQEEPASSLSRQEVRHASRYGTGYYFLVQTSYAYGSQRPVASRI